MQHTAVYLLSCKFSLHVSGVDHTHHQAYTKLVTTASGTGHIFCAATSLQRGQAWPPSLQCGQTWPHWSYSFAYPDDGCG